MPVSASGAEMPYAGTPEMDQLLKQINQNPQMLQVVGQEPALLAEIMKHVGLNVEEQQLRDIVDSWPDEAAEEAIAGQPTSSKRAIPAASRPELPTEPEDELEEPEEPEEPEMPDAA